MGIFEIKNKLQKLSKKLSELDELKGGVSSVNQLATNMALEAAIERKLQTIIDNMFDIGTMIISTYFDDQVEYYSDVILLLEKHNILPTEYVEANKKIYSFRNFLVHEYDDIDLDVVYEALQKTSVFTEFIGYITQFLEGRVE